MRENFLTFLRNFSHELIFILITATIIGLAELYQYMVVNVWH